MYIVPGSFDYKEKITSDTKPWKCKIISGQNSTEIKKLERELSSIPYTFKRPIPNQKVVQLVNLIQEADRKAGFIIGGVMKYVVEYSMEERRNNRKKRKAQKFGVFAQRLNQKEINAK